MTAPCIEGWQLGRDEEVEEGRCPRCWRDICLTSRGVLRRHQDVAPYWRPRGSPGVWCVGSGRLPELVPPRFVTVDVAGGLL